MRRGPEKSFEQMQAERKASLRKTAEEAPIIESITGTPYVWKNGDQVKDRFGAKVSYYWWYRFWQTYYRLKVAFRRFVGLSK